MDELVSFDPKAKCQNRRKTEDGTQSSPLFVVRKITMFRV